MSEYLSAASQALGVPEPLVQRSAEARAKANGVDVDEVLKAWAGGGAVATATATAPAPPAEETAEPATAPAPSPPAATPQPSAPEPAPEPAPALAPVMTIEEPEEEVEAAPLAARVRVAGRVGAATGAVLGLLAVLFASPWLVSRAAVVGEEGAWRPVVEVVPGWVILGTTLLSVLFGLVVAAFSRTVTGWAGPGMSLTSSRRVTALLGLGMGAVLGALAGSLLVSAFAIPIEGIEGLTQVPVVAGSLLMLVGGAALGWVTAAVVQAVGVPEGIPAEEALEVVSVRDRLASAVGIPLAAALALAVLVLPFAYILIRFPAAAPALAVLVSGSILGFAGLSASRPGMRVSAGDFLVAAAGVGVVVLIIVAVLLARGEGGHGEGGEEGGHAQAPLVLTL